MAAEPGKHPPPAPPPVVRPSNRSAAAELQAALRPLVSLIGKSAKARRKLAPASWQHRMLTDNLRALRLAAALLTSRPATRVRFPPGELQAALRALAALAARTEKTLAKFAPGSAHHTLQRNRLRALRLAAARTRSELEKHTVAC